MAIHPLMPQMMVPSVVGLTEADATKTITGAQLAVGTVTKEYSGTVDSGNIMSQNPASGSSVADGSVVNLVISVGFPPDPSTIAPPMESTVATTIGNSTAFLYSGANPIQTGVEPKHHLSL
jgi:beta-lactam-binding protein with PASTA domain